MRTGLAAMAATVAVALSAAPQAVAAPIAPAPAIAPGIGVGIYDAANQVSGRCTLGFLATGADGAQYAFTAGHCATGGDVVMVYKTAGNYLRVGQFANSVHTAAGRRDIALVRLEAGTPQDTRVLSRRPVEGVIGQPAAGDTLCFYGDVSGLRCGAVAPSYEPDNMVVFRALSQHGDSGAPVYRIESDGSATAVGILGGHDDGEGTSYATLLEPYLQQWNLTLATTPSPAAAAR